MPSIPRAARHAVRRLPSHTPNTSERSGTTAEAAAKSPTCIPGATRVRLGSPSAFRQVLANGFAETFCAITSKARRTSCSRPAKSAFISDFLGLTTTSTAGITAGQQARTDARSRRFIRLRSTAPPRARLTVKPIRMPAATRRCGAPPPPVELPEFCMAVLGK